ncbi:DUF982 domain-containing protein [Mycoplana rhizolycopersici]|uniref:DUF982 domain-containing protein n=1 Tax=Mycoplana rhizolycopersici TaxID=2746702 RepID=A0ABX2QE57_9HYPH|nr:DUF982 domain-containing protein [Rhizobium rhizolycopersici]NVP56052.1 DUF982 domain-containing protein [Rhizobium rhizolycopersici]
MLSDNPWSVVVNVSLPCGIQRVFHGPYDALDFLENEWPSRRGQNYDRAIVLCRASLDSTAPLAIAREAFVAASMEAGMAVRPLTPFENGDAGGLGTRI